MNRDRVRALRAAKAKEGPKAWYQVKALTSATAEIWLYDEIDWFWGVTAADFAQDLLSLGNVSDITLRINSPGGDVFEGIAIYNALRNHSAKVNVVVDGLAASIASVIAMAGDTVHMGYGAQMMIHDPWGFCVGNAGDMTSYAAMLDGAADNLAGMYAERAGGTAADWRVPMLAETWYTADEAVAAGLADSVTEARDFSDAEQGAAAALARWDLAAWFNHAGRDKAPDPAPILPTRKAAASARTDVGAVLRAAVTEARREAQHG